MPGTGIPAVDAAQFGLGIIDTGLGLINSEKTKREADRLAASRPQYQISPLAGQDLSLAQSDLANNTSAGERAYDTLNNQQYSNAIGATLKSGGSVNNIGDIYGNNQDGRLKLAMMKDNLRLQNIQNLSRASQNMQNEQQTQWQINQFAPWEDKAQAIAAARNGAQSQLNTGLNSVGAAIGNYGQAVRENNQFNLPTSINNNQGFNNLGYATGVPNGNLAPSLTNTNTLTPTSYPSYGYG